MSWIDGYELEELRSELSRYKAAIEEISALDPVVFCGYVDEWAEAACFNEAQKIANKALGEDV